jgi:uncharacterized membrane protein (DUF485 family)
MTAAFALVAARFVVDVPETPAEPSMALFSSAFGLSLPMFFLSYALPHNRWLQRGLLCCEFVIIVLMILGHYYSADVTQIGNNQLIWIWLSYQLQLQRDPHPHPVVQPVVDIVLYVVFVLICYAKVPYASDVIQWTCILGFGEWVFAFLSRSLIGRVNREEYATSQQVQRLTESLETNYEKLQNILRAMLPIDLAARLMSNVRCVSGGDASTIVHPLRGAFFALEAEELCVAVLRFDSPLLTLTSPEQLNIKESLDHIFTVHRVVKDIIGMYEGTHLVKAAGNFMMFVHLNNKSSIGQAEELSMFSTNLWVELLRQTPGEVHVKLAVNCGPVMGAILGSSGASFEYYGSHVAQAVHLLEEMPFSGAVAMSRAINHLQQGAQCDINAQEELEWPLIFPNHGFKLTAPLIWGIGGRRMEVSVLQPIR